MKPDLQAPVTQAPSTVTWRPAVVERAATPKVAARSSHLAVCLECMYAELFAEQPRARCICAERASAEQVVFAGRPANTWRRGRTTISRWLGALRAPSAGPRGSSIRGRPSTDAARGAAAGGARRGASGRDHVGYWTCASRPRAVRSTRSSASGERRSTSLRCSGVSTSTVAGVTAWTCAVRTEP